MGAIREKSFAFAIRVLKTGRFLSEEHREYIVSKQLIRSGTAVGALVREAEQAESKRDFVHKLSISLKEANETQYWLDLLGSIEYLEEKIFNSLRSDCTELIKILTSIIKSSKNNPNN